MNGLAANKIKVCFDLFKSDILALHTKKWNEENLTGKSYKHIDIFRYYWAIYYGFLLYDDLKRASVKTEASFETKYSIDTISKKLACHGISFDEILDCFGVEFLQDDREGIEYMAIQEGFVIESLVSELTPETIEFDDIDFYPDVVKTVMLDNLVCPVDQTAVVIEGDAPLSDGTVILDAFNDEPPYLEYIISDE